MAKITLKKPSDSKTSEERLKIKEHPHFDFECDIFAEEHYGTYLIVKNVYKHDRSKKHNRLYLDSEKELEFLLKTGFGSQGLNVKNHKIKKVHLFSIYPTHSKLIKNLISNIKRSENRTSVYCILDGINTMIGLFEEINKNIIDDPSKFNAEVHQKCLLDAILKGRIPHVSSLINLRRAWSYIRTVYQNNSLGSIPNLLPAKVQMEQLVITNCENEKVLDFVENKDEITLEVLFQLDYYSQIELERIIKKVKEYREWIKKLDLHGELFSQANLLKTFYSNTNLVLIRKLYIHLYKEDPKCWNQIKREIYNYDSEEDKLRHEELINISQKGINIDIKDEKMFAWWYKTLYPDWPFVKEVTELYNKVFVHSHSWLDKRMRAAGIILKDFNERILPDIHTLYPMYLRLLIDTSANTETVSSAEVNKKNDGTYSMGIIHHNLRMLDSIKMRSNTITPSFITKGTFTDQCLNFFTQWLAPIYERSSSNKFFQYFGSNDKILHLASEKVNTLNPKKKNNRKGRVFFEAYEIYKSVERVIVTNDMSYNHRLVKERVNWIKHRNIRAANNLKNYHLLYGEWVRARVVMGQQDNQVEKLHYRKTSWKLGDEHQIALSQLHIQKFVEGKVLDEQLENVFKQPHCDCTDNSNPTFEGAPTINDGEVCTGWRYCLTECDNSRIFPEHHGPTIMAWNILMEQDRKQLDNTEEWIKDFGKNYDASVVAISALTSEQKKFAEQKAVERIPFVRLMMMQTKLKQKIDISK